LKSIVRGKIFSEFVVPSDKQGCEQTPTLAVCGLGDDVNWVGIANHHRRHLRSLSAGYLRKGVQSRDLHIDHGLENAREQIQ
jgi:hypothetical protein